MGGPPELRLSLLQKEKAVSKANPQNPNSKTVTFTVTAIKSDVTNTVRTTDVSPQDHARAIISRLGFAEGNYDLVDPVTGKVFSPDERPFDHLTDGGAVTVQASRFGAPS